MTSDSQAIDQLGRDALSLVTPGSTIGLGSGRAAAAFIRALGERVQAGLQVRGLATSQASATLAAQYGIPLVTFDEVATLDITFDGADEVDPQGDLIKGYGGALLREKVVATNSRQLVILIGREKLVPKLGTRSKLPVEVVPFAVPTTQRALNKLRVTFEIRFAAGTPLVTDNDNLILDCHIGQLNQPEGLAQAILAIPGVVETGFFLGMNPRVLVAK
ncbi:MAG: ribose-5-phosphate isomerase RpiA [Planctomycetes bacterium]|nr:ribose-5-phosphate isomerase RpiA [Planctomycetota bacterium]